MTSNVTTENTEVSLETAYFCVTHFPRRFDVFELWVRQDAQGEAAKLRHEQEEKVILTAWQNMVSV